LGLLQRLIPAEKSDERFPPLDQAGLPIRQPEYGRAVKPLPVMAVVVHYSATLRNALRTALRTEY
jgi:hypothetical protein